MQDRSHTRGRFQKGSLHGEMNHVSDAGHAGGIAVSGPSGEEQNKRQGE